MHQFLAALCTHARPFVIAFALEASFVVAPSRALACSCQPLTFAEQVAQSAAVFAGKVERIDPASSADGARISMRVLARFKGSLADVVSLDTSETSMQCGVDFRAAAEYLVLADFTSDGLFTTVCHGTRESSANEARSRWAQLQRERSAAQVTHGAHCACQAGAPGARGVWSLGLAHAGAYLALRRRRVRSCSSARSVR